MSKAHKNFRLLSETFLRVNFHFATFFMGFTIVTKNEIVWKLARSYCLCYCKTFSLVPGSTECRKFFLPKCAVHYVYHLKSNNIVSQRKTINTEKYFYPRLISFNLKLFCT